MARHRPASYDGMGSKMILFECRIASAAVQRTNEIEMELEGIDCHHSHHADGFEGERQVVEERCWDGISSTVECKGVKLSEFGIIDGFPEA